MNLATSRRPGPSSRAFTVPFLLVLFFASTALGRELGQLSIVGVPEDPKMQMFLGDAWALYLSAILK
jgi:hypothetical protein